MSSQSIAFRLLGRAALILSVCALGASTLSDPLQKLAEAGVAETIRVAHATPAPVPDFTTWAQQERLALLRRIAGDADAVRRLSGAELVRLFGTPSLQRRERESVSWHFTSAECALDVYFPRADARPVYVEYRVRSNAQETGLKDSGRAMDHRLCVRSLFSHARFDAPAPASDDAGGGDPLNDRG